MTQSNRTKQSNSSNAIEDLTLDETKSENVKGGGPVLIAGYNYSFGVEREMKESGEKGGTED